MTAVCADGRRDDGASRQAVARQGAARAAAMSAVMPGASGRAPETAPASTDSTIAAWGVETESRGGVPARLGGEGPASTSRSASAIARGLPGGDQRTAVGRNDLPGTAFAGCDDRPPTGQRLEHATPSGSTAADEREQVAGGHPVGNRVVGNGACEDDPPGKSEAFDAAQHAVAKRPVADEDQACVRGVLAKPREGQQQGQRVLAFRQSPDRQDDRTRGARPRRERAAARFRMVNADMLTPMLATYIGGSVSPESVRRPAR